MIPVAYQKFALDSSCSTESSRMVDRNKMIWTGFVRPQALCSQYKIRVEYELNFDPTVVVLDPPLMPREDGGTIPHMFDQRRLCLFRRRNRHWRPSFLISRTVLPWAALWLYYYELWYATGEWRGGGEHPTAGEIRRSTLAEKRQRKKRRTATGG
jgi:hypothetical protein